jgi:hypothetical protein
MSSEPPSESDKNFSPVTLSEDFFSRRASEEESAEEVAPRTEMLEGNDAENEGDSDEALWDIIAEANLGPPEQVAARLLRAGAIKHGRYDTLVRAAVTLVLDLGEIRNTVKDMRMTLFPAPPLPVSIQSQNS